MFVILCFMHGEAAMLFKLEVDIGALDVLLDPGIPLLQDVPLKELLPVAHLPLAEEPWKKIVGVFESRITIYVGSKQSYSVAFFLVASSLSLVLLAASLRICSMFVFFSSFSICNYGKCYMLIFDS